MISIRNLLLIAFLCSFSVTNAQLSTNEQPISLGESFKLADNDRKTVPVITMPKLDMKKIEAEDRQDEADNMPPRFGYRHKVNYNLSNSGVWHKLPNGDRLWQLNIVCPSALSVNFCFNKFWIPEGGKFFVYSKERHHSIGAFTSRNNKGDSINVRGFATGLVYGDDVMLEYYQPKEVGTDAVISIEYVVQGYRYIHFGEKDFGESGNCQVNINCPEGVNWQNEKYAVAMIIVDGERWCTGSLLVTTDLEQKPYLLTADHCLEAIEDNHWVKHDAINLPNLDYYSFWWNYEVPGCNNLNVDPPCYCTNAATVIANNSVSDFALLQLSEDPKNLSNYMPFYLGWDISGTSGLSGVCIHHPNGDVKKISTVESQPISTNYLSYTESDSGNHWKVTWKATPTNHGTTEGGSSGSPLLTAKHKVIGQLHGGYSSCSNLFSPDWYGKFHLSWTGNGNNNIHRRLDHWLDSLNTGTQIMEGLLVITSTSTMTTNQELYSNIRINSGGQLTVQSEVELKGNSLIIVEPGGLLIIDGGALSNADIELKVGASLRITNGGVIETRNNFIAPVGATVDIIHGEITNFVP